MKNGMCRGRPKKKPGYNREEEIENLIHTVVGLAVEPFSDVRERNPDLPTLTEIAQKMDTTLLRIRKLLITADYFTSEISRVVQKLSREGMRIDEIMESTGLGKASVYSYLPYSRGVYNLETPTLFSEQAKRYRMRKAATEELHKGNSNLQLWKAIIAFEGYPFQTSGRGNRPGVKFSYSISPPGGPGGRKYSGPEVEGYGNEMWIKTSGVEKKKSISRSTVDLAYRKAMEEKITGPKALGVPGAGSYLFPVFQRIGVVKDQHWRDGDTD